MKRKNFVALMIILVLLSMALAACAEPETVTVVETVVVEKEVEKEVVVTATPEPEAKEEKIVVGFSQLGHESTWRTAMTDSFMSEAEKRPNIELLFSDGQQEQANQIKAMRNWVAQGVDVIAVSPIVVTGWDAILLEAKDAGVHVIFVDRTPDSDPSLYSAGIGSDFIKEGNNISNWLVDNYDDVKRADKPSEPVNIVQIEGTVGSSAAIERQQGFEEIIDENPQFIIIKSQSGNFTRTGGKEVMEAFLKAEGENIDVAFCHNDDECLGAIQAIKEYGLEPGVDIIVSSIDATRPAFEAMVEGDLNVTTECIPLYGPSVLDIAEGLMAGKEYPDYIYIEESLYDFTTAKEELPNRLY